VVSQVLPAIKTRAATVTTAAATFVRSLVLRGICASLITHTHARAYTRLHCIAAAPVFVVVVVVVIVADGETLDVKKF